MEIKVKPTNVIVARLGLQNGGPVHAFFTNECAKAMNKYVPFDEGNLAGSVMSQDAQPTSNVTASTITYTGGYAKYVYYPTRNGKEIHYSHDKHPLAGPYWDKEMWTAEGKDVVRVTQEYFDKYGGNE